MENPWLDLPDQNPYVLELDKPSIARYSSRFVGDGSINTESIPEPFIGNPGTATVLLLNLNPGDSPDDVKIHQHPAFRKAMFTNLRHAEQEYPFYALDPELDWSPCAVWWNKALGNLLREKGLDRTTISQRLCVIEWFPYHSRRGRHLPLTQVCPSQSYSFDLAQQSLGGKLIILMRSLRRWANVDPRFAQIPHLNNPMCSVISRNNTPEGVYDQVVEALRRGSPSSSRRKITSRKLLGKLPVVKYDPKKHIDLGESVSGRMKKPEAKEVDLSGTELKKLRFWKELKSYALEKNVPLFRQTPGRRHWYNIAIGSSEAHVALTVKMTKNMLGCEIYIKHNKPLFEFLQRQQEAIEQQLGAKLEWIEAPTACRAVQRKYEADIDDDAATFALLDWLIDRAITFEKVFGPLVQKFTREHGGNQ
jgi:hypothetical protein